MSESNGTHRQKTAWLLTAMLAPLARMAGAGWATVALTAAAAVPLMDLPGTFEGMGRAEALVQWLTVVLTAGLLLPGAGSCWPGEKSEIAVPAVLLLLAVLTRQVPRAAGAGGILAWLVGSASLLVWYLAMKGLHARWLKPRLTPWNQELLLVLLLPRLMLLWEPGRVRGVPLLAAAAIGTALLVQGSLSLPVAMEEPDPFYQMARSLRLGSLNRLEPLVSCTMTFSWFCLTLILVMAGKTFLERAGGCEKCALWMTAAAMGAMLLIRMKEMVQITLISAGILWIAAPFMHMRKRSKKDEKRC